MEIIYFKIPSDDVVICFASGEKEVFLFFLWYSFSILCTIYWESFRRLIGKTRGEQHTESIPKHKRKKENLEYFDITTAASIKLSVVYQGIWGLISCIFIFA